METFGEGFSIAMGATRTDFVAASRGIPRSISPLDSCMSASHKLTLPLKQQFLSVGSLEKSGLLVLLWTAPVETHHYSILS